MQTKRGGVGKVPGVGGRGQIHAPLPGGGVDAADNDGEDQEEGQEEEGGGVATACGGDTGIRGGGGAICN